ncbi:MAG TPA: molybdate ABC transporter substrate-binding protein [Thermoleophilaceae bacterium]|nr:molybdate ABC transporter substrate-binding protein [Thermoleophilaceae bacterium]
MKIAALVLAVATALAACGDGGGDATASDDGEQPPLVVSAAASMTEALEACAPDFARADVRMQFAGSDELAAQIRQGVKPDVYAAAATTLPQQLHDEGLLSKPVEFATNQFALAVPKGSRINSLEDLTGNGVKIAIGAEDVPIGAYTRETLAGLPDAQERAILENVRSNEPDVKGIVGKLTQRAADAGFVYVTDVNAAGGELEAIDLPAELHPTVTYAAGVVKRAKQPGEARAFVDQLVDGSCADALEEAGFGPAPP